MVSKVLHVVHIEIHANDRYTEELQHRHDCVLKTIDSLQMHFFGLYTSKITQCKMFYGDSPQCDSFQLGEMIKFFSKKGLMSISSSFAPSTAAIDAPDNAMTILGRLQECPSYQIDQNHGRCGLRTKLLVPLSRLNPRGQVGLCLVCWRANRHAESWLESPPSKEWAFSPNIPLRWEQCKEHRAVKEMYTADLRDWTPRPN